MLGHLRDDPEAFDRAAAYLRGDTPWRRMQAEPGTVVAQYLRGELPDVRVHRG
jgi:hypothetical protein